MQFVTVAYFLYYFVELWEPKFGNIYNCSRYFSSVFPACIIEAFFTRRLGNTYVPKAGRTRRRRTKRHPAGNIMSGKRESREA